MAPHPVDIHVGSRVRQRRSMLGLSQEELGRAVGVTFQQIQKYERGVNRIGSGRLYDFAKILKVAVSYFYEGAEEGKASGFAEDDAPVDMAGELVNSKEAMTLVRSYYRISDQNVRKKVLNLIKALGSADEEEGTK